MAKTKSEKKVNKIVKAINRSLEKDVFKNRFWIRQVKKARADGISFFIFEMKDREDPSRDKIMHGWIDEFEATMFRQLDIEINNFIVTSDFWTKYKKN